MPPFQLFSGVVGFVINVTPGGYDLTDGGGTATCTLVMTDPAGASHTYAMSVLAGNKTVSYTTTGSEFPTVGGWQCNVKAVWSGGKLLYTAQFLINVLKPN